MDIPLVIFIIIIIVILYLLLSISFLKTAFIFFFVAHAGYM